MRSPSRRCASASWPSSSTRAESAVSHQLRLLRSLRLVRSRRAGRLVFYGLDDEHIRRLLDQGRRHIEEETERWAIARRAAPSMRQASSTASATSSGRGVHVVRRTRRVDFPHRRPLLSRGEATLEKHLVRLRGVERLTTDVVGQRMRVAYDAAVTTTGAISEAVAEVGMRAWVDRDGLAAAAAAAARDGSARREAVLPALPRARRARLHPRTRGRARGWTIACMALAVVAGGLTTVRRAVLAVKHRTLDMYVLMVVAVAGRRTHRRMVRSGHRRRALCVAQALERRSMDRARRAISTLLNVDATEIPVRRGDQ